MKQNKKKNILFGFIAVFLFFAITEAVSRFFSQTGSFDYVERCIIEQHLAQKKRNDEIRIFLYGESTMHGSHLYKKSTIKKWIELYLENLLGKEIAGRTTIINFGRVGYDSRFIAQSFLDTIGYKPDLAVFYSVHNDFVFLENRQQILERPSPFKRVEAFFKNVVRRSAFVTILRRLSVQGKIQGQNQKQAQAALNDLNKWYDETEKKNREPQTNLLYPGSEKFKTIERKWQENIYKIIDRGQRNRIPVLFLNGIANLKDFPPYESVHQEGLVRDDLLVWQALFEQAERKFGENNLAESIVLYQKAAELDPDYALGYFRLGKCFEALGDYPKAESYYLAANDHDRFPTRAPSVVNGFYAKLADDHLKGVNVLDIKTVFEEHSPHGLIGRDLVVDHMHPTIEGQALIALEIVKLIYANDLLTPKENWHWDRLKPAEELKLSLGIDKDFEYENYMYLANFVGSYLEQAAEYLEKALAIKPHSIAAKSRLAWTYWQIGRKEEADQLYRELIEQAPDTASSFAAHGFFSPFHHTTC